MSKQEVNLCQKKKKKKIKTKQKTKKKNTGNERQRFNKNHFLFFTPYTSVKVSKFQNWHHPFFKTGCALAVNLVKKQHFKFFISVSIAVKAKKSIKTVFYLSYHAYLLK